MYETCLSTYSRISTGKSATPARPGPEARDIVSSSGTGSDDGDEHWNGGLGLCMYISLER
jgi:hypothetical protein